MKKEKTFPFNFVLEALDSLSPATKPMFGCHAVYVREKIVMILRKKTTAKKENGIWVATLPEYHASLKREFQNIRALSIFNSGWLILPEDADDFEESAFLLCDLILKGDPRIGKTPNAKKRKKNPLS